MVEGLTERLLFVCLTALNDPLWQKKHKDYPSRNGKTEIFLKKTNNDYVI